MILDGLRGVAAIVVVALHALDPFGFSSLLIPHATLAVDFFFCLSGFVIGYAYDSRFLRGMSFKDFAAARIIRLYPLVVLGTALGAVVFVLKSLPSNQFDGLLFLTAFAVELVFLPITFRLADGWSGIAPLDPPAWSLSFEFLANFVYAAFVRHLNKPVMVRCLVFGAFIVFFHAYIEGNVSGEGFVDYPMKSFIDGLSRVFFPFTCGLFLYRHLETGSLALNANFTSVITIVLMAIFLCPVPTAVNWLYESVAVVVLFPLIIGAGLFFAPGPSGTSLCLFFGRVSYPLYVIHYPLIRVGSNYIRTHNYSGLKLGAVITLEMSLATALSIIIMLLYDEPIRSWLGRKRRSFQLT